MKIIDCEEIWRAVDGYNGLYEVSSFGRVRSLDRRLTDGRNWKGRPINPTSSTTGHMSVRLCNRDGHKWFGVHRLVLAAFKGPCPDGMEGAHTNGIPSDNRIENLRWDTRAGNHADKARHGTLLRGEKNHLAKLTRGDVLSIFEMRRKGKTQKEIAEEFRVTTANISSVLNGKTWKHVRRPTT